MTHSPISTQEQVKVAGMADEIVDKVKLSVGQREREIQIQGLLAQDENNELLSQIAEELKSINLHQRKEHLEAKRERTFGFLLGSGIVLVSLISGMISKDKFLDLLSTITGIIY